MRQAVVARRFGVMLALATTGRLGPFVAVAGASPAWAVDDVTYEAAAKRLAYRKAHGPGIGERLDDLEARTRWWNVDLAVANGRIVKLQTDVAAAQAQLAQAGAELVAARQQIDQLNAALAAAQSSAQASDAGNNSASGDLSTVQQQLAETERQRAADSQRLHELEQERDQAKAAHEERERQRAARDPWGTHRGR